jgi:fructose-bisphosphate aldolase class 1
MTKAYFLSGVLAALILVSSAHAATKAISPWIIFENRIDTCLNPTEEPADRKQARAYYRIRNHANCQRLKLDFRAMEWKYRNVSTAQPKLDDLRQRARDAHLSEEW